MIRPGARALEENGANYARMRLWVSPAQGRTGLASDLALARQAHAAGMRIYLDIMYSRTWTDAKAQSTPAAWRGQKLARLAATVRSYTRAGHQLLIMIHYDESGNTAHSQASFWNLVSQGVPFDVIGLSYYPFYDGRLSQLRASVDALATQFHKKIVIAETQYPWTLANGDSTANSVSRASQLPAGYPASADDHPGQVPCVLGS